MAAFTLSDRTVTPRTAPNNAATGRVTISGTATVGETLTATVSGCRGRGRAPGVGLLYRSAWFGIEGRGSQSASDDISSTSDRVSASDTYTLTDCRGGEDHTGSGSSSTDHLGNTETADERPLPRDRSGDVGRGCQLPGARCREGGSSCGARGSGWRNIEISGAVFGHGYGSAYLGTRPCRTRRSPTAGATYAVDYALGQLRRIPCTPRSAAPSAPPPRSPRRTYLGCTCATTTSTSRTGQSYSSPQGSPTSGTTTGLDWSTHTTRRVALSAPDTTAPTLQSIEVDSERLTFTYDEAAQIHHPRAVRLERGPDRERHEHLQDVHALRRPGRRGPEPRPAHRDPGPGCRARGGGRGPVHGRERDRGLPGAGPRRQRGGLL